jgi:hypothetical protein
MVEGQIHIGAIPVSLPAIALLTTSFAAVHSRTRYQVISQTSIEIQRGLDEFTIDVGVTHLDNDPLSRVRTVPLYRERYVLTTHEGSGFAGLQSISWATAATVPLCLLTPSMQNRRIIDMQFHAAGAKANAVLDKFPGDPLVAYPVRAMVDNRAADILASTRAKARITHHTAGRARVLSHIRTARLCT